MDPLSLPRRPRLLVLEPDPATARDLAAVLAGTGFRIDCCARPAEASAHVQVAEQERAPFELLILPAQLNGISGTDVAASIAQRAAAPPGILLTSGPYSAPTAPELARCGAHAAVVLLPLRADQLRAALAAVVPAQRLQDAARAQGAALLAL